MECVYLSYIFLIDFIKKPAAFFIDKTNKY